MKNTTKEKMLSGKKAFGAFIHSGSPLCVEALGLAGLDFVVIDTEHGPFTEETAAELLRAAKLRNLSPFVRVRDSSRAAILRMLDIGMEGIVIPNVHSVKEVKEVIEYGKYYPMGRRGFAFGRAAGFGHEAFALDKAEYCKVCNREQLIIPQCETLGSLENIEEIVGIDGVDGIFVGPMDLSVALENPFVFDDKHKAAVARVLKACKEAKKFCFTFTADIEGSKAAFELGFDALTQNTEISMMIKGFKDTIKELNI